MSISTFRTVILYERFGFRLFLTAFYKNYIFFQTEYLKYIPFTSLTYRIHISRLKKIRCNSFQNAVPSHDMNTNVRNKLLHLLH